MSNDKKAEQGALSDDETDWHHTRVKHLELIQASITRMGAQSASLKGYVMIMLGGVLGLTKAIGDPMAPALFLPIILLFSLMDAKYLQLERGFRDTFETVRSGPIAKVTNFNMTPTVSASFASAFFSWTVAGFYGAVALTAIAVVLNAL